MLVPRGLHNVIPERDKPRVAGRQMARDERVLVSRRVGQNRCHLWQSEYGIHRTVHAETCHGRTGLNRERQNP